MNGYIVCFYFHVHQSVYHRLFLDNKYTHEHFNKQAFQALKYYNKHIFKYTKRRTAIFDFSLNLDKH